MKCRLVRFVFGAVVLVAPGFDAAAGWIGNNASLPNIYDVNITTGATSNPRSTGLTSVLCGIAYDPTSGNVYGLTALNGATPNSLVKINPVTGAATVVGSTGLTRLFEGDLAFDPVNGALYGLYQNPDPDSTVVNLLQINPVTGHATVVGPLNMPTEERDFSAMAFDTAGTLYAVETTAISANSVLYTVNPITAALLSSVTMNVNLGTTAALAFDPATGTAYLADGGSDGTKKLYTLNLATGVATMIGALGDPEGLAGLAFIPVPEPGILALLLTGLGVLLLKATGGLQRLRKR
jgi:hypothetical protein